MTDKKQPIIVETLQWKKLYNSHLYTDKYVEIDLIVSGSGSHNLPNYAIPCKAGDVCVLSSYISHSYEADDYQNAPVIIRLLFDPNVYLKEKYATSSHADFCYGVFCENPSISCATLTKKSVGEVTSLLTSIEQELGKKQLHSKSVIASYISLLLITLSRYMNEAIRKPTDISQQENALVSSALRIINDEYTSSSLTLEYIAKSLFVSQAQLSRSFKRCTGKSFSDYLRQHRMTHACELLKNTDVSVEQIVASCGLRDLSTFYQSFQKHTQMTPNQYRNYFNKKQTKGDRIMVIMSEISENLQKGKAKLVKEMVQQAIDEGASPSEILSDGLLAGMGVIGEKFKNNEVYVPEVLVAARAMNIGITVLKPHLVSSGVEPIGKVCIGTVQGDLHDIGKNIVKMMLEGKGLDVIDLGVDVAPETFVKTAIEENCQIICCSALLTTTMDVMADVVKAAEDAGIRDKVKIMVGGAPVNEEFCASIGADCYTSDAASCADAAAELCKSL